MWLGIELERGVNHRNGRRSGEGQGLQTGTKRRRTLEQRRNPGAGGGFEIKSKDRLPVDSERITINIEGKDERVPRRVRIAKKDLEKFGFAAGRAGCRAASRGSTAVGHTEECRKRIMGDLEKARDERIERERDGERREKGS